MRVRLAGLRALPPAAAAFVLASCTVGPDYSVPDAAMVNSPAAQGAFVSGQKGASSADGMPAQWWHLYDNPKLDGYIAQALQANTNLRVAEANLERSYAEVKQARAFGQPSVNVDGGVQYAQDSGEQYLIRARPPVNTDYSVGVTVGYDLDLFGRIRRGVEAAKADSAAAAAARDLARVNIAAETIRAYVDACGYGLELQAAQRALSVQKQGFELTRRLRQGGRAIDLDVTRARQSVDQTAQSIPSIEAGRKNALFRLATLMGKPPSEYERDLEQCNTPPRIRQPLPVGDGASLLKRRPDVREAERDLAAATASIGIATAALYPDIGIGLSTGSLGATSDAFTSPTNLWNIGAMISWQANQSSARAKIAASQASAKGALAQFDGVVLTALQDAESALNVYVHDLQRESSAQASRDDAMRASKDAEKLFARGRSTSLDLVDAQRTLASAEVTLAQLELAISEDQTNVFLAFGGGWGN